MKIVPSLCLLIMIPAATLSAGENENNPLAASVTEGTDALAPKEQAARHASGEDSSAIHHQAQTRRAKERAGEARERAERRRSADEWRARGMETRGGDPRERSADLFFSEEDRARIAAIPLDRYPEDVRLSIQRIRNQSTEPENRSADDVGLSPGWSGRLESGQILDETHERLATTLPRGLRRRLPPTPPDHEDIVLEDRLIRVNRFSREIVDSVRVGPGRADRSD